MADRRARQRFQAYVGPILRGLRRLLGGRYERELRGGLRALRPARRSPRWSPRELWTALQDAYAFHRRGWYIHFEVMYALVANFLAFYGLAVELGLDRSLVSRYLAGRPTTYLKTDEELWRLAARARELGVDGEILRGEPDDAERAARGRPDGARWWARVRGLPRGLRLAHGGDVHDRHAVVDRGPGAAALHHRRLPGRARGARLPGRRSRRRGEERDTLLEQARSHIGGGPALQRFEEALATNQAANFAWWNDEHNYLLDRRIQIPVRRITLALGERLVDDGRLDRPDDLFYVFKAGALPRDGRRRRGLGGDRRAHPRPARLLRALEAPRRRAAAVLGTRPRGASTTR